MGHFRQRGQCAELVLVRRRNEASPAVRLCRERARFRGSARQRRDQKVSVAKSVTGAIRRSRARFDVIESPLHSHARACRGHPRLFLPRFREQDVDGRDIRAFTPVFDGLLPGHDSGEVDQRDRNPLSREPAHAVGWRGPQAALRLTELKAIFVSFWSAAFSSSRFFARTSAQSFRPNCWAQAIRLP